MKIYSLSNLSQREFDELYDLVRHRRNTYYLLSLMIVTAPFTMSFALYCNDILVGLRTGFRKKTSVMIYLVHNVVGLLFPLVILPICNHYKMIGNIVLSIRLVD
jgi:hypothetical protein